MIKFFRRIRQQLLSENKFSKYLLYAIGEIILVVIGILIALQFNNLNEQRKSRNVEKEYLLQLYEDFSQNQEVIKYYSEGYERQIKLIDVTLRHTGPNAKTPHPKVFDSIQYIMELNVQLLYATDASNSGLDLELLKNNELKQFIKAFTLVNSLYLSNEKTLDKLVIELRKKHQEYIPLIAQETKYTQTFFEADTLGLLRDNEFQNITVDRLWVTRTAQNALLGVEKHNDSIVKLLKEELKTFKND